MSKKASNQAQTVVDNTPEVKAPKAKRAAKTVETVEAVEVPVVVATAAEPVVQDGGSQVESGEKNTYESMFADLANHSKNLRKEVAQKTRDFEDSIKELKKFVDAEFKRCENRKKRNKGKRKTGGESKQSGFTKASPVPKKISQFLGLEPTEQYPRPSITKMIYKYISDHKLYGRTTGENGLVKENKKQVIPDDKLREVFNLDKSEIIEFGTFQKLLSRVYNEEKTLTESQKTPVVVAPVVAPVVEAVAPKDKSMKKTK